MNDRPKQNGDDYQLVLAIKEEKVSVSPESSETIHGAVINQGDEEEYVDIQIRGIPTEWITIDKPVIHVQPGKIEQFMITVHPPPIPESRVGQYPMDVQAVSQINFKRSAKVRSHVTVAAYQSRGRIGVMLGSIYFSVSPGSGIVVPVLVQNRGNQADSFRLSIKGIAANWVSTNAAFVDLEPNASREIQISIRAPLSPQATAGRHPFTIQFTSQKYPDQKTEIECILTISVFSRFSISIEPKELQIGQFGNLVIENQGNTFDTYSLEFQSPGNLVYFEKIVQAPKATGTPREYHQIGVMYLEIPQDETVKVAAGKRAIYPFRSGLRSKPIFGNEKEYPFSVKVTSTDQKTAEVQGAVNAKGFIPNWLVSVALLVFFALCLYLVLPLDSLRNAANATQTAEFNLTQAALSGESDNDGDGLTNAQEIRIGTDLQKADTDEDGLLDGEEHNRDLTNPLIPDTDGDGLLDGEEVRVYLTNPLAPDSDNDALNDGAEIAQGTNPTIPDADQDGLLDGQEIEFGTSPLVQDTDQDGLLDGKEIEFGTNPLVQDTDKDGLLDSQENQACPNQLTPDSDRDGIIDGNDLDPCNPGNPSLTATVLAGATAPSATEVVPTSTPPQTVAPTSPIATPTLILPNVEGIMVFESNRDGNSEIYALNLQNRNMLRLTENTTMDTQPAIAPDALRVAYVSNQGGNNEIFLTGLDRRVPVNLTNNPGDDQEPVWSPDGNWIAFTSNRDGNQEIYIMRSDGTEVHNLTSNNANDFAPTWFSVPRLLGAEDWIAFTSTRDGNLEIYKIRPDGTGLANITKNPANDYSPAGATNLALLTFVSDRDGNPDIFTITDNGGAPTNLTKSSSQDLEPAIGPAGNWIIFTSDRDGNLEIYLAELTSGNIYNLTRNTSQDRYPDW